MADSRPASWIVSHLPGRLRLRHASLRRASANLSLQATLRDRDGILSVTGNPATGGILVRYDPIRLSPPDMEARVAAAVAPPPGKTGEPAGQPPPDLQPDLQPDLPRGKFLSIPDPWAMNRAAKIGMLGSLSGTLLALAVGKRLHAAFGVAHLAFLAVHLATHRKKLLR